MEPVFQVTFAGGGNLACASIATIGHNNPNWKINILTRRPEAFNQEIVAYTAKSAWESKGNLVGRINKVSSDPKEVIPGSQIVIICSPAHTKPKILTDIKDHLMDGCLLGSIFGQGAFDWQAQHALGGSEEILKRNITLFSLQYVPFICKAFNYGKEVNIIGPKKHLYVTSFPLERVHYACSAMSLAYNIPSIPLPGFLNLTLTPSNQIIHPGRVYAHFKDWDGKQTFDAKSMPKLYEDLTEEGAHEIQLLDDEIQAIKKALLNKFPELQLPQVLPIKDRICAMYDGQISDKSSLKRIFNTNIGYSRVVFPMIAPDPKQPDRVILNKDARFFWEDVPFGLVILKDIGRILGVETPNCTKQIQWHQKFMPVKYVDEKTGEFLPNALKGTGAPSAYGIDTPEKLVQTSLSTTESGAALCSEDIFFTVAGQASKKVTTKQALRDKQAKATKADVTKVAQKSKKISKK